ncbi:glycosyl transferase [Echinicola sp. CAU 1574]|uniref:Glycosyl transferase n=1 Tax=Echinicola arenosa TaxID=2774144 RepID=A0ABR9ANS9_9BACT|nr:glycosyl transferase [Echinicola arenosa]MBD8490440.1 glycosyl transferase [Echinicola arenosa]
MQNHRIIFTLCSNNYLAHAKTLGDSIKEHAPECKFIIGLVDDWDDEVDYQSLGADEVLKFDQLGVEAFPEMLARYNIIEFNTAVKPYYIEYFFNKHGEDTKVYYIDPDIKLYHSLDSLHEHLDQYPIILTPNLTVTPQGVVTGELASLRHGMFNLGFIGLKHSNQSKNFVHWWRDRLRSHCKIDKGRGIFVDQKWVDLAPLFFKGIYTLKHQGCNMAWWNFSERDLKKDQKGYYVNNADQRLIFFHFSGFDPNGNQTTVRMNNHSFKLEDYGELKGIFKDYSAELKANDYDAISKLVPKLAFYKEPNGMTIKIKRRLGWIKKGLLGKV